MGWWLIIRLGILFFCGVFAGVFGLCLIQAGVRDNEIRRLAFSRQLLLDIFHWNNAYQILPEILEDRIFNLLKDED
uniref:Uncharacterized protein n=1 Tax=viral metagenome TaxID=1070528 RepID=A0A6H2A1Z5_9ZZZZ